MPSISMERVIDVLFLRDLGEGNFSNSNKMVDGVGFLQSICKIYGLRHSSYMALDKQSFILRKPKYLATYPVEWQDNYHRNFAGHRDVLIQAGLTEVLPFDWYQFRDSAVHAEREPGIASLCGLGSQGLSVPIRGHLGARALFSVTGDYDDKNWRELKRTFMRDFVTLAHFLHKRISGEALETDPMLSEREKEILQLCAMGMTSGGIADRLEITVSTVKYFLNHVRQKMEVSNTTHAVAKAIKLGIITAI